MNERELMSAEVSRLRALEHLALLDTLPEERFDRVIRLAMALMNMPYAYISLVSDDRTWAKATFDRLPYESSREQSICQFTIENKTPTVINDTLVDERVNQLEYVINAPNIRSYIGVPLNYNGEIVGALCALDTCTHQIAQEKINLLKDLAAIVENEFETQRLKIKSHGLQQQGDEWKDLSTKLQSKEQLNVLRAHTLELVAQGTPIQSTLHEMIAGVEREFPQMMCSILLLDKSGKRVEKCYAPSLPDFYNQAIVGLTIGAGVGSCGTAASTAKRVIVSDIMIHPYWKGFTELASKANLGSCWSEPIISSEGAVLGTFAIYHQYIREPQQIEISLIEQSAHLASIALDRHFANKLIWKQANYDALTGLPNRELSSVHINVAINNSKRNKQKFALMFLDLDRFKEVNDTLGHDAGDLLLIEAAARIQSCVRANDSVARLGGDEFVVVLNNIHDQLGVEKVARNIMQQLTKPFLLNTDVAHVSASIGITIYPDDGNELDVLMKNADQAMYRAKELGRDRFDYFTTQMRDVANDRRLLIEDLRQAISNNELVLHYQPIIDINSGTIKCAEALLRWQHPTRGVLYPESFIELSDESGITFSLTEWVLLETMHQAHAWSELIDEKFKIFVNTSLRQFIDNGRHSLGWLTVIENNPIFSSHLVLEVSEKLLVEQPFGVKDKIERLIDCGVEIAIHDFSTGYSSLGFIKQFNVNYVKINQQFISQISDTKDGQALCEAMVAMANKLGAKVVAQGIEQPQQLNLLAETGCELGQGFHIAYPMDTVQCTDFLMNK